MLIIHGNIMQKILLPAIFLLFLSSCTENPGKCEYSFRVSAESPAGGGCVSSDDSVFDNATCEAYAKDIAEENNAALVSSLFFPDEEC